jgi:hypothetical protein
VKQHRCNIAQLTTLLPARVVNTQDRVCGTPGFMAQRKKMFDAYATAVALKPEGSRKDAMEKAGKKAAAIVVPIPKATDAATAKARKSAYDVAAANASLTYTEFFKKARDIKSVRDVTVPEAMTTAIFLAQGKVLRDARTRDEGEGILAQTGIYDSPYVHDVLWCYLIFQSKKIKLGLQSSLHLKKTYIHHANFTVSRIRFIPYFNLRGVVPGTLHCVLLGVCKFVIEYLWDLLSEDGKTVVVQRLAEAARSMSGAIFFNFVLKK